MPTKNPRRGYGEGFEYHRADDGSKPTAIQIDRQLRHSICAEASR